jgi:hypothetical protein
VSAMHKVGVIFHVKIHVNVAPKLDSMFDMMSKKDFHEQILRQTTHFCEVDKLHDKID